jgi:hypothetical protein
MLKKSIKTGVGLTVLMFLKIFLRWICQSDAECSKALEYYNLFCKGMFRGNKCSDRCKNSLAILRRQRKAAKLRECECSVDEMLGDFFCRDIKRNMDELCRDEDEEELTDVADVTDVVNTSESVTTEYDDNLNDIDVDESPPKSFGSRLTFGFELPVIVIVLQLCIQQVRL